MLTFHTHTQVAEAAAFLDEILALGYISDMVSYPQLLIDCANLEIPYKALKCFHGIP